MSHPRPPPITLLAALVLVLAAPLGCARTRPHVQAADEAFDAILANPEFPHGDGPRVLFDDGHRNFHTSEGRYAPFVRLLRNDGFQVASNAGAVTAEALAGQDLFVVVNALPPEGAIDAFTVEETAAVAAWVEQGGGLLLVADHRPFGSAIAPLAARSGVTPLDSHLKDEAHSDPTLPGPYFLLFDRANGLLGDHPIVSGRRQSERIDRVVTFGGEALRAPAGAVALLRLSPSAVVVQDPNDPSKGESPAGDAVHALALRSGRGRVVVVGEAAVFTAQVITGQVAQGMGLDELRLGMSRADTDDRQLALNTVRWLAGRLD
jgi:hypothetical protein